MNTPTQFSTDLLRWYRAENRSLIWRDEKPDPYRVWLSEIMLQQTTFATVTRRFGDFVAQFPTVAELARASQAEVLQHWAGLGYYARARNLHRCAQIVVKEYQGTFPETAKELQSLPGIGSYTAAAIASIAFDEPTVAVDSNIKRLYARLHRCVKPISETDRDLQGFFQQSQQGHRPSEYLQAWMDLGELVCKPRNPDCAVCPVQKHCKGRDIARTLPRKPAKKPRTKLFARAFLLRNDRHQLWLRRRPQSGLLAGMLEIPTSEWRAEQTPAPADNIPNLVWRQTEAFVHHQFTHIDLTVQLCHADTPTDFPLSAFGDDSGWYDCSRLHEWGLPSLMKKIVDTAYATE